MPAAAPISKVAQAATTVTKLVAKLASEAQTGTAQNISAAAITRSRGQRMRDMETHVFVKNCLEQFDGEIVRIDLPH